MVAFIPVSFIVVSRFLLGFSRHFFLEHYFRVRPPQSLLDRLGAPRTPQGPDCLVPVRRSHIEEILVPVGGMSCPVADLGRTGGPARGAASLVRAGRGPVSFSSAHEAFVLESTAPPFFRIATS